MTTTDIEEIATIKVKEQVLKNNDCLRAFINENDKTPLWDGNIYVYSDVDKKNEQYEGKIDVQIKGRKVEQFKEYNTYSIKVATLKGFKKEVKGTLLFVVDFIDFENYKIYYCNLLPVDLYKILKNVKEEQQNISLKLKEINNEGPLSFKNVCLNFYKNSNKQAGKRIIDESEFGKIEEIQTEIVAKNTEYEEYMETADVYSYAKLKDTHEEVVTVKGQWTTYNTIKKNILINNKKYYYEFTAMGVNKDKFIIGPITINFNESKLHIDITGNPKKRVKDLRFILDLFHYQYIMIDNTKLDFPFDNQDKIDKNKELFRKKLKYYEKIVQVFQFFNTDFDINYDELSDDDLVNLHCLMNLFDGHFNDEIKELQKYYIKINKYKFVFVVVRNGNKLYNFYSQEMINKTICYITCDNKKIKTTIYANLTLEEFIDVDNFDEKMIIKSFKEIELTDEVLDSINLLILTFIDAYDKSKNIIFLNVADKLSQINCKNRNNDVDIINSKQIKYRKKGLSAIDKKMLNGISKKHEYEKDYIILSCIDILLENRFLFDEHYRLMKAKDKELFKTFPIYNLINKVHISGGVINEE